MRAPQVGVYGRLAPVRRTTSAPQAYLRGWLNGRHLKGVQLAGVVMDRDVFAGRKFVRPETIA